MLAEQGHEVVLHARNKARAKDALAGVAGAEAVLIGDLASISETRRLAEQANKLGRFDAIIHNAGMGYSERTRVVTEDGLPKIFAVNTLAPYFLTALIERPKRLIYLSSGLHRSGDSSLKDLTWEQRRWNGQQAYSDSKLHDVLLAFAVARRWKDVFSNALEPGWVPTKMGGSGAPESLEDGARTQTWLATSDAAAAKVSGEYFYHMKPRAPAAATRDEKRQEQLLAECERYLGVGLAAS